MMGMRIHRVFALITSTMGAPADCNITSDFNGQTQIWVPQCQGIGCYANGIDRECAWHVHNMAKCKSIQGDVCLETDAARKAQRAVGLAVTSGTFDVDGYVCGGTSTGIWYPSGEGVYPLIIYLHGSGGGDDGRDAGMASVAASGFVVIAPLTGGYPGSCGSTTEYHDAVIAWTASKAGGSMLSPGLAKVDWSKKTGIWGYSMGGKTTPKASVQPINVGAIVCSHGARNSTEIAVPALFITGTRDTSSSPADVMLEQFQANPYPSKVFANLQNGQHTWPITKGIMNPWVAKFFACELSSSSDDCNLVYGSGPDSLCEANRYAACTVVRPSLITV